MSDGMQAAGGNRWGQRTDIASATTQTCDAATDGLGFIFQSLTTEAITHLGFRYGLRTGTPPTYIAALEGIDASGLPNGTILGGGSPASGTFTPPADTTWNSLWRWVTLSNAYTPTRGEKLALTIRHSSGTVNASNNSTFTLRFTTAAAEVFAFPYGLTLTAGTWAKVVVDVPIFAIRTANQRYGMLIQSLFSTTVTTTGHRSAMRFTLPATWAETFALAGARMSFTAPAAAGSFKFALWQDTTELTSMTLDSDMLGVNTGRRNGEFLFTDTTLPVLTFGTQYRLGLEVISSLAAGIIGLQLSESDDRLAYPLGTNRGYSTWNGSTWTDDNTVMPYVELIFADITEPVSAAPGRRDYPYGRRHRRAIYAA